jgi:DNA-binding PadR family transcriptional regulator
MKGRAMIKFSGVTSNWEFVAWFLIDPCVTEKDRSFTRAQIMRSDYEEIYDLLIILGHKKHPQHPEETIQKTLQNMRDKGWITFIGQGDYRLTTEGYDQLLNQKENIDKMRGLSPEEHKTLRDLAKKV